MAPIKPKVGIEVLIGKSVQRIDLGAPAFGMAIIFADGSGMRVNSRIEANLTDAGSQIVRVDQEARSLLLHLAGGGTISISLDPETNECVEYLVFQDTDGSLIVAN
jgi:hypothetical protein